MHALRRIFALPPRRALARLRYPKTLAALLIIVLPGGLVLPICYGLYGAIRHTLSTKAPSGAVGPEAVDNPAEVGR